MSDFDSKTKFITSFHAGPPFQNKFICYSVTSRKKIYEQKGTQYTAVATFGSPEAYSMWTRKET
eukprot:1686172-Amphidinium_carterae.1